MQINPTKKTNKYRILSELSPINMYVLQRGLKYREEQHQRDFIKNEIKRRKRELSKAIFLTAVMFLSVVVISVNFNIVTTLISIGIFAATLLYLLYKA